MGGLVSNWQIVDFHSVGGSKAKGLQGCSGQEWGCALYSPLQRPEYSWLAMALEYYYLRFIAYVPLIVFSFHWISLGYDLCPKYLFSTSLR